MNEVILEAKTKEEVVRKAMENLNASEKEIIYHIEEKQGKLFKNALYQIKATTFVHIVDVIIEYIKEIVMYLGLDVQIESSVSDRKIILQMYSENNAILIGKNGQTLKALETLAKQYIFTTYNFRISLNVDVENYKEQRLRKLESLAKKIAREVKTTKIEATLENMNSFERRIVHNALTDFKGIKTVSEGEEPLRHVVIKPIEE